MSTWEGTTLNNLGFISRGKQTHYPKNDPNLFWKGNIPFVETQDVKEAKLFVRQIRRYYNQKGLHQGKLFPINTVCITNNANVADAALLSVPSCLSCDVHGFNAYEGIACPRFIKYCFDFSPIKKKCISVAQAGTTRLSLTSERLLIIKFPNPPFEIQKKIGDILSAYDELIENCERQIEILENLRTKLYKEWFINFRFPDYEKCKTKNKLPEGWRVEKLKDVATIQKGKKSAGQAIIEGKYPFFTASFEIKKSNSFSYDSFSLIIAEGGKFHVKIYNGKFEASDHTYIVNFKNEDYIFLAFKYMDIYHMYSLNKSIVGTTIKNLPIRKVKELPILIPEKDLIKKFNIFCMSIQTKIEKLEAKKRRSEKIKNQLLDKFFNNKINLD